MSTKTNGEGLTSARVLCDEMINGVPCKIDDIVELGEEDLRLYRKSVDPHPDAVVYAQALKRRAERRRQALSDLESDVLE